MTIRVTSKSINYDMIPQERLKRYVRTNAEGHFYWVEVDDNDRRFDVRQGRCDETDLPPMVVKAARKRIGYWPSYVDWPFPALPKGASFRKVDEYAATRPPE